MDTNDSGVAPSSDATSGESRADNGAGNSAGNGEARKRRRGSRGGKNRRKPTDGTGETGTGQAGTGSRSGGHSSRGNGPSSGTTSASASGPGTSGSAPETSAPPRPSGPPPGPARKPQIGDTRPAPPAPASTGMGGDAGALKQGDGKKTRRRGGRGRSRGGQQSRETPRPDADAEIIERRRGRERNGRPIGRYLMCVQVRDGVTQVAVMEGRNLIEHHVSRPADDIGQIHGNIYLGRVQNVLAGMEAAFVDIATPKNAVLYRGDVSFDTADVEHKDTARIEHILRRS
ncbi:MAG: ribonuclease E/G, partial [Actinomycetota bacterium]